MIFIFSILAGLMSGGLALVTDLSPFSVAMSTLLSSCLAMTFLLFYKLKAKK